MEENVKEKKSTGLIYVVIILLILCLGMGTFIFVNKDKLFAKESEKTTENSEKEQSTEKEEEQNTPTETEEVKAIDLSKSLNTNGYTYSSLTDKDENVGFSLKINDDKKSVTVTIYEKGSKMISEITHSTWSTDPINKSITGFNKKIKSTYIGLLGHDSVGTVFYYIMEDGTLTYSKVFEQKTNSDGTTYYDTKILENGLSVKTVDNVDGIIKLYGANGNAPQSTGYYTTLAAQKDGSFYDLSKIIK